MLLSPHGFCLLGQDNQQVELYRGLLQAGFAPWDRNGLPLFVALQSTGPKPMWFEAGYLAGARVPLFLIGKGARFRERHLSTIGRLGGWACEIDHDGALLAALARRGIEPTAWDREHAAEFLAALEGKAMAGVQTAG